MSLSPSKILTTWIAITCFSCKNPTIEETLKPAQPSPSPQTPSRSGAQPNQPQQPQTSDDSNGPEAPDGTAQPGTSGNQMGTSTPAVDTRQPIAGPRLWSRSVNGESRLYVVDDAGRLAYLDQDSVPAATLSSHPETENGSYQGIVGTVVDSDLPSILTLRDDSVFEVLSITETNGIEKLHTSSIAGERVNKFLPGGNLGCFMTASGKVGRVNIRERSRFLGGVLPGENTDSRNVGVDRFSASLAVGISGAKDVACSYRGLCYVNSTNRVLCSENSQLISGAVATQRANTPTEPISDLLANQTVERIFFSSAGQFLYQASRALFFFQTAAGEFKTIQPGGSELQNSVTGLKASPQLPPYLLSSSGNQITFYGAPDVTIDSREIHSRVFNLPVTLAANDEIVELLSRSSEQSVILLYRSSGQLKLAIDNQVLDLN